MEETMQTLTIEVKDDFMTEFMKIIDNAKDKKNYNKLEMISKVENLKQ